MELRIDGMRCDLQPQTTFKIGWSAASLQSADTLRTGSTLHLTLPATANNQRILADASLPHMAEAFNETIHRAELYCDEVLLFEGVARLVECCPEEPERCYRLELRGGAAAWAGIAAQAGIEKLPIDFSMPLLPNEIVKSWACGQHEPAVRFLPIAYDDYRAPFASGTLHRVEQLLSVDDFYPFLHLATLLKAIFTQAGYEVKSRFLEGEFFQKLYISGAYRTSDTTARRRRMDFLALRSGDGEAAADALGRVYASPFMAANSVGNLVDAYLPNTPDSEGKPLTECFSTNGCFSLEEGEILFRPLCEVEAGFEYHLHYRTDYRILTRKRLRGFDSIYLGEGADFRFELKNRFEDRREKLTAGQAYRLVIFDYAAGERFRLKLSSGEVAAHISERAPLVTLSAGAATGSPELERLNDESGLWEPYPSDWALYDGYIGESGTTEAEVVVRTAAEKLTPTSPKYFRHIYLYGAEEGMKVRILKGCTLRPSFSPRPAYGEQLSWGDVAHHTFRQAELLEAVVRLFDLCILSDEAAGRVYIEPYADFYPAEGVAVEWSDRMVARSLSIEQSDLEEHEARRYGYSPTDGAVLRLNEELEEPFGEWVARSDSKATLMGEEDLRSPLFAPTLNFSGHFESAPSALIPCVGNRDSADGIENFEFTPRLVRYMGMAPLPAEEGLGAPAPEGSYPLAAFHLPDEGFTLCFEDRDGAPGLHRFHLAHEAVRNHGRRLRLQLHLNPEEVEALNHPSSDLSAGSDARFRFCLGGEELNCRLAEITEYDPASGVALCRFHLLPDDRP